MNSRSNGQIIWETRCGNQNWTTYFLRRYNDYDTGGEHS